MKARWGHSSRYVPSCDVREAAGVLALGCCDRMMEHQSSKSPEWRADPLKWLQVA